jgi:hypothetical protein
MSLDCEVDDEHYNKALGQYRFKVRELLEPLRLYGQGIYCDQVEEHFLALALTLHMRLMGEDIPFEIERPHW